jgi:Ala-tRNA(Pro) deacylase
VKDPDGRYPEPSIPVLIASFINNSFITGEERTSLLRFFGSPHPSLMFHIYQRRCTMTFSDSLSQYLLNHNIHFDLTHHRLVFTAQEVAQVVHVPGKDIAKTILVFADGSPYLAVLPAHHKINVGNLRDTLQVVSLRLAHEDELAQLFPSIEIGAMPPIGTILNIPVIVAESLTHDEKITFNAGTHTDVITMPYAEFEELVKPAVADFSEIHYGKVM